MELQNALRPRWSAVCFIVLACICPTWPILARCKGFVQSYYVNAQLPWHKAVLDSNGRLLAWYHPEENLGYDHFLGLDWNFLEHKVPNEGNTGLKVYLVNSIFDPGTLEGIKSRVDIQHNPPSLYAHLMDALVRWYPYSGDEASKDVLRGMLDYQLAHGTSPSDWNWPDVPFTTSCDGDKDYGRCLQDTPREFYGGIQPGQVGELGLAYVLFYETTGDQKYLQAGLKCAEALASRVRPGDATHTPWPFRLDARTGRVIGADDFGGLIVAPVRLFDELMRLGVGNTESFRKARNLAWHWILNYPMNPASSDWNAWTGYYEDVPNNVKNVNDMDALMTAYYILSQPDPSTVDSKWRVHVGYILDWDRSVLGRGPFWGSWAIDEQEVPSENVFRTSGRGCCSRAGLVCRTSEWGAINAMYSEKTGSGAAREKAFRSLNYATYFAASDGKIACCGLAGVANLYWFEDGYADAGRNFAWAMAAVPSFAPVGQDHLLDSTSVVQTIHYAQRNIEYQTFDKASVETLRLNFIPAKVMAGDSALQRRKDLFQKGYTVKPLEDGDYVIRVRHTQSNEVQIQGRQ